MAAGGTVKSVGTRGHTHVQYVKPSVWILRLVTFMLRSLTGLVARRANEAELSGPHRGPSSAGLGRLGRRSSSTHQGTELALHFKLREGGTRAIDARSGPRKTSA